MKVGPFESLTAANSNQPVTSCILQSSMLGAQLHLTFINVRLHIFSRSQADLWLSVCVSSELNSSQMRAKVWSLAGLVVLPKCKPVHPDL